MVGGLNRRMEACRAHVGQVSDLKSPNCGGAKHVAGHSRVIWMWVVGKTH